MKNKAKRSTFDFLPTVQELMRKIVAADTNERDVNLIVFFISNIRLQNL